MFDTMLETDTQFLLKFESWVKIKPHLLPEMMKIIGENLSSFRMECRRLHDSSLKTSNETMIVNKKLWSRMLPYEIFRACMAFFDNPSLERNFNSCPAYNEFLKQVLHVWEKEKENSWGDDVIGYMIALERTSKKIRKKS